MKTYQKLLATLLIIAFGILSTATLNAQCTNSFAFGTATAPTGSTPVTITTCAFTTEYSTINSVIAGNRYVVTATGMLPNLHITIRFNTPAGAVVAAGISPLQFTAPCSGTYYAHYNSDAACGTASAGCVTATIACSSCGATANQCSNGAAFGSGIAPTVPATPVTLTTCAFAGEYSTISSVAANTVYRLTASIAGTFITIRQGSPGGTVIASGITPLIWTSTTAGTYYSHYNTNTTCGTAFSCITAQIFFIAGSPCAAPPTGCTNTAAFGSGTIPANNSIVTLTTCAFAGEYSTVFGAVAGQTLQFTATASYSPVYLTVRSGTFNGPVVAAGNSPLSFVNTFTGTLFVHYNTNSSCGTLSVCHNATVQCTSCPPPAAANDLCTGAITIACGGSVSGTTVGAGADANACGGATSPGVWYQITPATTSSITLSLCTGTTYDSRLSVYQGCGGTMVACNDDFCGLQSQVTFTGIGGTNYRILVNGFTTSSAGPFTLTATCAAAFDPCASILASAPCGNTNTTVIPAGTGAWAFGPFSPPGRETIYTFTPTVTGNYTITQNTSTVGSWVDYFFKPVSGGCNNTGWTFIIDAFGNGITSPAFAMTAGVPYYILLDPENTVGGTVNWQINCSVTAPPNDQCTAVTPVIITPGGSTTYTGTTLGATTTGDGSFTANPTVWHAFTLTGCADVTLSYCGNNPPFGNVWLNLATACPPFSFTPAGTFNNTSCTSGPANYQVTWLGLAAGTYYVPIMGLSTTPGFTNTPGPYSVTLSTVACPPPPTNDNCISAIPVSCGSTVTGSTSQATNEVGLPCGSANKGVWYSITLPTSGIITANTCTGSNFDTWLSLYSGTCGALTCIVTNDDFCALQSQITSPPVPAGTYYILVSGFGTSSGNFTLTVNCTLCSTPPVGGTATGPSTGCTGSQLTYTVTGSSSQQWQVSTTSITGPFTNITGATSATLNYTPPSAGTYYFRNSASAPGCTNDFSNVVTTTVTSSGGVLTTSITPANACPGQSVTLDAVFSVPGTVTITVSGTSWLDETEWTVTGGFSGGPYGFGSTNTVTISPPSPFIFSINTQGFFNDNVATYSVVCNATSTVLVSGTLSGGQTFTSGSLSCGGSTLTMTNTQWTGPSITTSSNPASFVANPGSGGTYYFTANAPNGCPLTGNVNLIMLPAPSPSPSNNSPVCVGQTLTLSVSGGVSYAWSGPNGYSGSGANPTVTGNAQLSHAGTYTVTATNTFGCTGSATTTVIVHELPVPYVISSSNPTCLGYSDGEIVLGSSGASPFLFAEMNNSLFDFGNTGTFSGLTQGLYTFIVTDDNGCESNPALDVLLFDYDPIPPQINCPANITVNTSGQCGQIVNYNTPVGTDNCPGANTVQLAGLASGSFFPVGTTLNTFQVTDAFGQTATCSFTVTVVDNQPPTVTGCPSSFSACNPISWTAPSFADNCAVSVVASHSPGVFPSGTTTVTYTGTDPSGNVTTCTFNVTVLEPSVAPTAVTTNRAFNNICLGENITLTLQGGSLGAGAVWKWYSGSCGGTLVATGVTSITVAPTTTTTYFVRAEGTCNTTACASVQVIVSTTAPATSGVTIVSAPDVLSTGVVAQIVVSVPGNAVNLNITTNQPNSGNMLFGNSSSGPWFPAPWSTNQTTFWVQAVGHQQNYNIFVRAANACGQSGPKHIKARGSVAAPVSITGPVVACGGSSYTYTSAPIANTVGYFWSLIPPSAGTISGGNNQTVTVTFAPGFTTAQLCVHGRTTFGLDGPNYCITVSNTTAIPGTISGNANPCQGSTQAYSIAAVPGATSYNWTVLGSPVIGQNGTSITVSMPGSAFSGQVCVTAVSPCGPSSSPSCLSITSGVTPPIGPISGPSVGVCGAANVNYSLGTGGANSYVWNVPSGATIVSGQGTNSINVTFSNSYAGGLIEVSATYPCGTDNASISVSGVPAVPSVTPNTLCANSAELYIASASGSIDYTWIVNGTQTAPAVPLGSNPMVFYQNPPNYNEIGIQWGPSGNSFSVTANNSCGSSAAFNLNQNCRIITSEGVTALVEVFPNPTRGLLNVKLTVDNGGKFKLELTEITGRILMSENLSAASGVNDLTLDLSSLAKGVYFMSVYNQERLLKTIKVAVE